jgi:glycosyltransferase involved in cell wall biosynthesis
MRIAQIATLYTPVRPCESGSVEHLVWLLTRELTRLGHDVTVFAAAGSQTSGELVATLPGSYAPGGAFNDWQLCEWVNLCRAVEQSDRFDILHSHAYLRGLPLQPFAQAPMVHTMHVLPGQDEASLWSMMPGACVTAISHFQWSAFREHEPAAVIHHGVDPTQFTFRSNPEDYVCYLGRFIPEKGPLSAIAVARSLGLRLVLAGPSNEYYHQHVEPTVDGQSVQYVGYVNGQHRDRLLGGARALLYPVQEAEPFGLVLIEAMMCGTPVAALRHGAVAEIVDEGVTGHAADTVKELSHAVRAALALDRGRVRARAESRFTAERMAREYAQLYERLVHGSGPQRLTCAGPGAALRTGINV